MIEGERRTRAFWVFGLDGVSVALAISLALLALKTLARKEAMVRRRSEELEGFAGRVAHDLLNPISAAEMSLAATERGAAGNERMIDAGGARAAQPQPGAGAGRRPVRVRAGGRAPAAGRDHVGRRRSSTASSRSCAGPRPSAASPSTVTPLRAPVAVRCASGVLASLLSNLVRNAIKHMGAARARQVDVRIVAAPRSRPLRGGGHRAGAAARAAVAQRSIPYVRGARHVRAGAGPGPGDRAPAGRGPRRPLRRVVAAGRGRAVLVRAARRSTAPAHEMPAVGRRSVEQPLRATDGGARRRLLSQRARERYWRRKNGYVNFCCVELERREVRVLRGLQHALARSAFPRRPAPTATDCTVPLPATT